MHTKHRKPSAIGSHQSRFCRCVRVAINWHNEFRVLTEYSYHTHFHTCQVSCLHLCCNNVMLRFCWLSRTNRLTCKQLPKYLQPLTWWSTLQDLSLEPTTRTQTQQKQYQLSVSQPVNTNSKITMKL